MIQKLYRPEIDGLRGIAIIGVLLFHFSLLPCSGGYTGVDIFFVISGFLITRNIYVDIQAGSFSFIQFYLRRMKRLFPALFVIWLLTLIFGFLLLTPEHLMRLGKSLVYSCLSLSNFFFWQEAGYFDTSVNFKPLLHTWSLAVEEQFYLLWPAILFLLSRWRKTSWIILFILLSGLLSLFFAEKLLATDASASFYLAPFRIVEFAIGALLVWFIPYQPKNKLILEPLLLAGYGLILYAFFSFTKQTPFPGYNSLIPAIGAALVIYGGSARFSGLLLRFPLLTGIGLISYSLYLVHWPLLIFYKYWKYSEITPGEQIVLLLISLGLAQLSYKFVEQPFRKNRLIKTKKRQIIYASTCSMLVVALLISATVVRKQDGFPGRISTKFSQIKDATKFHAEQYGGIGYSHHGWFGAARKDKKQFDVVLAGDSYALQYSTGFDNLFKEHDIRAVTVTDYACIFGPDITFLDKGKPDKFCASQTALFFKTLQGNNKPLIFAEAWIWYQGATCDLDGKLLDFKDDRGYQQFLLSNLNRIREIIGYERQVILLGSPPGSGNRDGVTSCLNRPNYLPNNCVDSMKFHREKGEGVAINRVLNEYASTEKNTTFLDPYDAFCQEQYCFAVNAAQDKIWYSDGSHVSKDGSVKVVEYFGPEVVEIIKNAVQVQKK